MSCVAFSDHFGSSVWVPGRTLDSRLGGAGMAGPVDHALAAISGKRLIVDAPKMSTCTNGTLSVKDLPFKPIPEGDPSTSHVTHSLEILRSLGSKPDMQLAMEKWSKNEPVEATVRLTTGMPPHKARYLLVVDDVDPTKWMMIRHCHYEPRGQVKRIHLNGAGEVLVLDPLAVKTARLVAPLIHQMMSNITGEFLSTHSLVRSGRISGNPSADEVKDGFAYIKENCPMTNSDNQALQCVELERNDPNSKIFGWRETLIEKAIRNLRHGGSLAKVVENYPMTLFDFKNWVVEDVIVPILRNCRAKATMLIGVSELGKTPLALALSNAISGYWRNVRSESDLPIGCRTASHLDFFREEPTSIAIPSVFDDGDMTAVSIPALKAFLDVEGEDARVYARWGAAQSVA